MSNSLTTLSLATLLDARKRVPPQWQQASSVLDQFPGLRTGPKRGQGLEFDDLRQYLPGDDIRHIDWNVTARSGEPYTRLYREEREHSTTVIVDLRPSMFTGSAVLKAVRAGELAATTLWQAMHSGDRCSAVVFSVNGIRATRPASAKRGVLSACELIADEFAKVRATATAQAESPEPALDVLFDWLNLAGRRTGVNLLFSSFDQPAASTWPARLKAAGVKQTLVAMLLLDALETQGIPTGAYHYRNTLAPTQGHTATAVLDTQATEQLRTELHAELSSLRSAFTSAHIPLLELDSECNAAQMLAELARRRII